MNKIDDMIDSIEAVLLSWESTKVKHNLTAEIIEAGKEILAEHRR